MSTVTVRPAGRPLDEVDVHAYLDLPADCVPSHEELAALRVELMTAIGRELVNRPGVWTITRTGSALPVITMDGRVIRYAETASLRRTRIALPKVPVNRESQIREAAAMWRETEEHRAAFVKGAEWADEFQSAYLANPSSDDIGFVAYHFFPRGSVFDGLPGAFIAGAQWAGEPR